MNQAEVSEQANGVVSNLVKENEDMKRELAILHEYCNLDVEHNSLEALKDAVSTVYKRTEKYANLKRSAGPIYTPPKSSSEVKLPVPDSKKRFEPNSLPYQLADALLARVDKRCNTYGRYRGNPYHWELLIQKQAYYFDLLLHKDGKSVGEVIDVLDFSQNDEFWKGNIKSGYKFRFQYEKLLEQISVAKDDNSELTEKIIGIYRALINNPSYNPSNGVRLKFIRARERMQIFFAGSEIDDSYWPEYLLGCLEKNYVDKGETVYPGHTCSDNTWGILMPQYMAEIGLG